MKLLDNSSRLNKLVVCQGLRISSGDSASLYILFKKLEKRVQAYLDELQDTYAFENCASAIRNYVGMTGYKCITRLNKVNDIRKLQEYQKITDVNLLIYQVCGRNVAVRIQKILSK